MFSMSNVKIMVLTISVIILAIFDGVIPAIAIATIVMYTAITVKNEIDFSESRKEAGYNATLFISQLFSMLYFISGYSILIVFSSFIFLVVIMYHDEDVKEKICK